MGVALISAPSGEHGAGRQVTTSGRLSILLYPLLINRWTRTRRAWKTSSDVIPGTGGMRAAYSDANDRLRLRVAWLRRGRVNVAGMLVTSNWRAARRATGR